MLGLQRCAYFPSSSQPLLTPRTTLSLCHLSFLSVTFSSCSSLAFSVSGHSLCWLLAVSVRFTASSWDLTGVSHHASIYRSRGSQCSCVLGELTLCCLFLSQVMRRSHEAREKLLRLGIFRQVDVLIDTCHGKYHGGVSL